MGNQNQTPKTLFTPPIRARGLPKDSRFAGEALRRVGEISNGRIVKMEKMLG